MENFTFLFCIHLIFHLSVDWKISGCSDKNIDFNKHLLRYFFWYVQIFLFYFFLHYFPIKG